MAKILVNIRQKIGQLMAKKLVTTINDQNFGQLMAKILVFHRDQNFGKTIYLNSFWPS